MANIRLGELDDWLKLGTQIVDSAGNIATTVIGGKTATEVARLQASGASGQSVSSGLPEWVVPVTAGAGILLIAMFFLRR